MPQRCSIAVIGLGTFGSQVACELSRFGDHVLGIDKSEATVSALAGKVDRLIIADGSELKALEEAGVGDYDICVVATAGDLEDNLLAVMNAREVGASRVWAKSMGETHTKILTQLGVDRILKPEVSYADLIAQQLHNPLMKGSVRLGGETHFSIIEAPKKSCGRRIPEDGMFENGDIRCVGLLRDGDYVAATAGDEIREGDDLLFVGSRDAMRRFADGH